MKIILVSGCFVCPFGAMWNLEGSEYRCSKTNKVNKDISKVPEDCPLDDAVKKISELLHKEDNNG